jgi:hypothetical protein
MFVHKATSIVPLTLAAALSLTLLSGCGNTGDTASEPAAADPTASTEASDAQESAATAQANEDLAREEREAQAKRAAIEAALAEQKIIEDPKGQWAATATSSSAYYDHKDQESYSAWQATGAPNTERPGDARESWASKDTDAGIEWLQVTFEKPVHASEIRVRQNYNPGAIIKVELIDDSGSAHTVFEDMDSTKYPEDQFAWFIQSFDQTPYTVTGAKLTLAANAVLGYNEIDAIQLIGE